MLDIVRTQIYLRKEQHHRLRMQAHLMGVSLTELLRRALDAYFVQSTRAPVVKKGLSSLVGLSETGPIDGSLRHDDYVADAIAEDLVREKKPHRRK